MSDRCCSLTRFRRTFMVLVGMAMLALCFAQSGAADYQTTSLDLDVSEGRVSLPGVASVYEDATNCLERLYEAWSGSEEIDVSEAVKADLDWPRTKFTCYAIDADLAGAELMVDVGGRLERSGRRLMVDVGTRTTFAQAWWPGPGAVRGEVQLRYAFLDDVTLIIVGTETAESRLEGEVGVYLVTVVLSAHWAVGTGELARDELATDCASGYVEYPLRGDPAIQAPAGLTACSVHVTLDANGDATARVSATHEELGELERSFP